VAVPPEVLSGTPDESLARMREIFAKAYAQAYDVALDQPVEVVAVRATQRRRLARRAVADSASARGNSGTRRSMQAYSFALDTRTEFALLDRADLPAGATIAGPAIVTEPTATTYVDAEFAIRIGIGGCMFLTRRSRRPAS
jgi:N-methylhydantoinase A